MKKSVLSFCLSGLMVISTLAGCVQAQSTQTKPDSASEDSITHVVDSAKIVAYDNAAQVIEKSKLIVEATKISEEAISYSLGGGRSDNFTMSQVKIDKLIKSHPKHDLQTGDTIKILESEWIDPVAKNIVHHTEGYLKMKQNKGYLLYLGYDEVNDHYYPLGPFLGKIPKDTSEEMVLGGTLDKRIDVVVKELRSRQN